MKANDCRIIFGKIHWFCGACEEWKKESEFYKQKARRNHLSWACKPCHNKSAVRTRNKYKALQAARKWRKNNLKKARGLDRKRKNNNPSKSSLDPEKVSARNKVFYAVKIGRLRRPKKCSKCGNVEGRNFKLNAHHSDYEKPLSVEWLCTTCHGVEHRRYE